MVFQKYVQMLVSILVTSLVAISLFGCSSTSASSASSSADAQSKNASTPAKVKIGTMPTEDFFPMWVAEQEGMFKDAGVEAELAIFDSAPALSAAIASGEVDMAMVDVMRAIRLCESGTSVDIEWITLGAEADQGTFGVLAPADAPYSTLTELAQAVKDGNEMAKQGVGLAANTVPEYVYDMLCKQAGVNTADIPVQEVASLPERFGLVKSGKLAAAALPSSLMQLGASMGLKVLADDSQGDNVSQSVMIARSNYAADNADAVKKVAQAWDSAANAINADHAPYMSILVEKANLNTSIVETYNVSTYPTALKDGKLVHIAASLVQPQIDWMLAKGYAKGSIAYDQQSGKFTIN